MPDDILGTDLRLLPNLERENDRFPGHDLFTQDTRDGRDLLDVTGVENLQQALLMRFLLPKGSLAHLGHPEYGSSLYKLVGELNTQTNRDLAKLYVLEALGQESRIAQVLSVTVTTDSQRSPTQIDITAHLRAVNVPDAITLSFPITLT